MHLIADKSVVLFWLCRGMSMIKVYIALKFKNLINKKIRLFVPIGVFAFNGSFFIRFCVFNDKALSTSTFKSRIIVEKLVFNENSPSEKKKSCN